MDANERELILKDEVYRIVGAAMEVSKQLRHGFSRTLNISGHSRPLAVKSKKFDSHGK